ncbi:hypothetical protein [Lentzea sp. NBRC 102530]|uniref:hypothetical protein n=1 Tax=Lentzea sp. NBRC 102530 TaxID=3032201 RepID=UPI0024A071EB|nr:hypothetical protein [Lentzea sp. NBRC 102530]GLY52938.1 hypothetical protein Lesp01_65940 [Lentzea sp. NBRC 102530]
MDYTRRDLAQAVLDAHPDSRRGLNMFYGAFSDDMKEHQVQLRDGLLKAFGVDLETDRAMQMMLNATVASNAAIRGPMSNFGEAGLLINRLEGSGALDRVSEIHELNEKSAEAHLDIVEVCLGIVDSSVQTVTTDDLVALGVNVTPPSFLDYEMDY